MSGLATSTSGESNREVDRTLAQFPVLGRRATSSHETNWLRKRVGSGFADSVHYQLPDASSPELLGGTSRASKPGHT